MTGRMLPAKQVRNALKFWGFGLGVWVCRVQGYGFSASYRVRNRILSVILLNLKTNSQNSHAEV